MTKKIPRVLSAFDINKEAQRKRKKKILSTGGKGRPTEIQDGRRVNVYLDESSLIAASKIGDGNVSAGIRLALNLYGES